MFQTKSGPHPWCIRKLQKWRELHLHLCKPPAPQWVSPHLHQQNFKSEEREDGNAAEKGDRILCMPSLSDPCLHTIWPLFLSLSTQFKRMSYLFQKVFQRSTGKFEVLPSYTAVLPKWCPKWFSQQPLQQPLHFATAELSAAIPEGSMIQINSLGLFKSYNLKHKIWSLENP